MTLALRASLTAPTRAITLHAPKANRSAMVGPRRAMTVVRQAHAGRGYESDSDFNPYVNDQLTHSVAGEYEMAGFFLLAGGFFMLPVMFPGVVLVIQSIFESFGWNNGVPM